MPVVHAYRRKQAIEVDLFGTVYEFKPDEAGQVVCDVPKGKALDRLLEIDDAYRLLDGVVSTPAAEDEQDEDDTDPDEGKSHVLTNDDGETVDLDKMSDEQLHAFAKANHVKVHPNAKGDTVRERIVAALT